MRVSSRRQSRVSLDNADWQGALLACGAGDALTCQAALAAAGTSYATLPGGIVGTIGGIRASASNARILVTGYPRPFSPDIKRQCAVGVYKGKPMKFSAAQAAMVNQGVTAVNRAIASAVGAYIQGTGDPGVTFVDITQGFENRVLCGSGGAWISGLIPGAPVRARGFLPTVAGHRGIAQILASSGDPKGPWPPESCTLPDPTQPGREGACVTPRTARLVEQLVAMQTGHKGIYCWDPHDWNPTSDHPKGKACDLFFAPAGQFSQGADKDNGDRLADWLVANAKGWAISYVIWQGRLWTADKGWRSYTGGGIYDPSDPSGGHFDHIHVSLY